MVTNILELLQHCICRKATPWESVQQRERKLQEHRRKKAYKMKRQELVRNSKYFYMWSSPLCLVSKPMFPPQASWDLQVLGVHLCPLTLLYGCPGILCKIKTE